MPEEQQAQAPNQEAKSNDVPATPSAGMPKTDNPSQEQTVPYTRFKEINDELKAIKDAQTQANEARRVEDEQKLAQQAEWQKLADNRKAAIDELKPQAELAAKLTEMVTAQYAAEIREWPEQVTRMAPSEDASILTKLEWMNKAKPLAVELMADKTPAAGNGRRPAPVSQAGAAKADEAARTTWANRARQRYR